MEGVMVLLWLVHPGTCESGCTGLLSMCLHVCNSCIWGGGGLCL